MIAEASRSACLPASPPPIACRPTPSLPPQWRHPVPPQVVSLGSSCMEATACRLIRARALCPGIWLWSAPSNDLAAIQIGYDEISCYICRCYINAILSDWLLMALVDHDDFVATSICRPGSGSLPTPKSSMITMRSFIIGEYHIRISGRYLSRKKHVDMGQKALKAP